MIVLDTDVLIEIFDKESAKGDEALSKIIECNEDIATTSINLHEILYGLQKYAKPVKDILLLRVIDYTKRDAELSAELELKAERMGTPVSRTDTMIAAIALNRRATLFTFNVGHFNPLSAFGLKLFTG
ncbi:MAG: type II toxin-antitoxin system VapC family toxin [Candidatus Freyarchaeota archaeon]|nr:type II toxin-antitoxin system VapC family toxin [Candidatus Jordarchaeia archaeon]MBS7270543.1 type II toxin-antitoxin system VapC family toxin [Candidatus Jordarchaeia archaeon]MBS7281319.1 type II toxin-antitoxin system VapC family toxin [Candidatus Jordarchaeia archaeon]